VRLRRRRLAAALAALSALVLTGCTIKLPQSEPAPTPTAHRSASPATPSPAPTAATPTETGIDRFYSQQLDWEPCGGGFDCATLTVPIDYDDPDGDTIGIAVNRLPASGDRIGSLVVNPGGPGVPGLDYARGADSVATSEVLDRYDLVGFDPRGVGESEPIDCIDDQQLDDLLAIDGSPDDDAEAAALDEAATEFADACGARVGPLLAHLSTEDVARDLDVLRAALGDDKLTYLGKSYGTYIGSIYAELFPDRVGRLVLDGVLDPAVDAKGIALEQARSFDAALASFVADCAEQADCPLDGDTDAGVAQVADFLDDVDATPLTVDDRELTQSLAMLGIALPLYEPRDGWPLLRQALADGFAGDGRLLLRLSDAYTSRLGDGTYASNLNEVIYGVNCLDHGAQPDLAGVEEWLPDFEAAAPIFGPYVAYSNLACAHWPVPPVISPHPIAAAGADPILVVGTTRDPATPYEWAQGLAGELDSAVLLTYDGDGHTAYRHGSSCIDDAVDAYLIDGTLPAEGTTC
jgi:pimeloyl-ACP methyl ester carboxylesterase